MLSMGRWDQKRPAVGFDLDKAGVILIGTGVLIAMLAAGSNIPNRELAARAHSDPRRFHNRIPRLCGFGGR